MQYPRLFGGCSLLCLMLAAGSSPAVAGPISLGTWYEFGFDPNHTPFAAGCQPADPGGVPCRAGIGSVFLDAAPWTLTSSTAVVFTITDGFLSGDFFDVFDLGLLVGSTPSVSLFGGCGLDPRVCVLDPSMSHASLLLPAGAHSITVFVHEAQILGEGFFIATPVPEPTTFALVAIGAVALVRRSRPTPYATQRRVRRPGRQTAAVAWIRSSTTLDHGGPMSAAVSVSQRVVDAALPHQLGCSL